MKGLKYVISAIVLIALIAGAIIFSERQSGEQVLLSQTVSPQKGTITVKKVISGNLYPIKEI